MFIRFLVVGVLGFLIDASTTYLLIAAGIPNWISRIPAIVLAMFFTWTFNRYITYKIKSIRTSKEVIRYAIVATFMAIFNYLIYLFLTLAGFIPLLALLIGTASQAILSFHLYRHIVFK